MDPAIILVTFSVFILAAMVIIGMARYWQVRGSEDWLDVSDAPGDGWDRSIAVVAMVASAGISFGCLWGW